MRLPKPFTLFSMTAFLVVAYVVWVYVDLGPQSPLMGFESSMQQAFDRVSVGQHKSELYDMFGEPRATDETLAHSISYREPNFSKENLSKCVEYIYWTNGANWYYCFGIDEHGVIVIKADGHS